ncbi:hypothetical protein H8D30_05055 [bacterium]|nr:hypothetical protein [bacterium]
MKTRHGCATVILVLASMGALFSLLGAWGGEMMGDQLLGPPPPEADEEMVAFFEKLSEVEMPGGFPLTLGLVLLGLAAVVGLWMWKRWGFWSYLVATIGTGLQQVSMNRSIGALMEEEMIRGGEELPFSMGKLVGGMAWAGVIGGVGLFVIAMMMGNPSTFEQLEPMPPEKKRPPDEDWDTV